MNFILLNYIFIVPFLSITLHFDITAVNIILILLFVISGWYHLIEISEYYSLISYKFTRTIYFMLLGMIFFRISVVIAYCIQEWFLMGYLYLPQFLFIIETYWLSDVVNAVGPNEIAKPVLNRGGLLFSTTLRSNNKFQDVVVMYDFIKRTLDANSVDFVIKEFKINFNAFKNAVVNSEDITQKFRDNVQTLIVDNIARKGFVNYKDILMQIPNLRDIKIFDSYFYGELCFDNNEDISGTTININTTYLSRFQVLTLFPESINPRLQLILALNDLFQHKVMPLDKSLINKDYERVLSLYLLHQNSSIHNVENVIIEKSGDVIADRKVMEIKVRNTVNPFEFIDIVRQNELVEKFIRNNIKDLEEDILFKQLSGIKKLDCNGSMALIVVPKLDQISADKLELLFKKRLDSDLTYNKYLIKNTNGYLFLNKPFDIKIVGNKIKTINSLD